MIQKWEWNKYLKMESCRLPALTRMQQAVIHIKLCEASLIYTTKRDEFGDLSMDDDGVEHLSKYQRLVEDRLTHLTKDYASSKFLKMLELYNNIPKHEKVIIVSYFTSVLALAMSFMKSNVDNLNCHSFTGATRNKKWILNSFNEDPSITVLFLSAQSGGEGIDLTVANHMIFLDLSWSPQADNQVRHRICRMNQKKNTNIHVILTNTPFEMKKERIRHSKLESVEAFIRGKPLKRMKSYITSIFKTPYSYKTHDEKEGMKQPAMEEAGPSRRVAEEAGPSRRVAEEAGPSRHVAGPSRHVAEEAGPGNKRRHIDEQVPYRGKQLKIVQFLEKKNE
jgi:SNF2 family DNA or RNA helicase